MPKTKGQLEKELKEAKERLVERSAEVQAMAAGKASGTDTVKMVPIRNYGGTLVFIPYEVNGIARKPVILEASGRRSIGAIPLEVWLELEENDLVRQGYIARTDQPITNPNVIEDIEEFFDKSTESQVRKVLKKVTNPNVLYRCVSYLESIPKEDRTGKQAAALAGVCDRVRELTGAVITTEDDVY